MSVRTIRVIAAGLKPNTNHVLKVGDEVISEEDIQVTGKRKGEGPITTSASGSADFTLYFQTSEGQAERNLELSAPFSKATAALTF